MFKSRRRIAEEEAKKEEGYIPTKDLKADETEEERRNHFDIPWTGVIVGGVLLIIAIVCIILIFVFGPTK
ncbi:MAG: hypothetical protein E7181_02400 [Erysipelotrichaceae bacterium]|nr:hypothetical protein [Erysipelotrichaceae bacterium]